MMLSIIIPVLNEAASIDQFLQELTTINDSNVEIIVVDGGSSDQTESLVAKHNVMLVNSPRGRARQMNAGAIMASGDVLLFAHSDTKFSSVTEQLIAIRSANQVNSWGFFKVKLSGQHWMYRIIELMMNIRSQNTGVATGDQCIFVNSELFKKLEGYKDIPLMEDVELSKRLRSISRPCIIKDVVTTSSRRWEKNGILPTILLMWRLRFLFFIGVSPSQLAKEYLS